MNIKNNNKIPLFSALLIYIAALYTPFIRFVSKAVAPVAEQASWLNILPSMIIYIPLLFMLSRIMKTFEGQSLYQIMCCVFGKIVGKILGILLTLWLFILLSMYVKYAGETLVTTVYVGTDIRLILFIIVTLTAIMLRSGLPVLSRMTTILFIVNNLQFTILVALLFIDFDIKNATPISTQDILPVVNSSIYPLSIMVYITFTFIFNDQIKFDQKSGRKFAVPSIFLVIASTSGNLAMLGIFGADLVKKLKFPFHAAVENISVFGGNTGIESLFISLWMMLEFVLVSFFAYLVVRLLREIFNLQRETPLLTAVMGLAFVFSIYFCADVFELLTFSQYVEPWFNITLGVGIPLALFITAKARKMLPPLPKRQRRVKQPET